MYTKGPWVKEYDGSIFPSIGGTAIADIGHEYKEWEANSILISAAPELLDALISIYEDVAQGAIPNDDDPWFEQAKQAIAKAKGETK